MKDEVIATLERAAEEIGEKINFDALSVYAYAKYYQTEDYFLIGKAVYAPNGKWEDAKLTSPKLIQVNLGKAYFQEEKNNLPQINEIAYLISKNDDKIAISKKRDSWENEDIITNFPSETKVKILDIYYWGTEDYIFVRYYISVNNLEGWVHGWDLSINKN